MGWTTIGAAVCNDVPFRFSRGSARAGAVAAAPPCDGVYARTRTAPVAVPDSVAGSLACDTVRIIVAFPFFVALVIDLAITFALTLAEVAEFAPSILIASVRASRSSGPRIPVFEVSPGHLQVEHGHVLWQGGKGLTCIKKVRKLHHWRRESVR
jgi:hypothetical protein